MSETEGTAQFSCNLARLVAPLAESLPQFLAKSPVS